MDFDISEWLEEGEAKSQQAEPETRQFKLDETDMGFVNAGLQRVVEPGEFRVQAGELSAVFRFEED